MPKCTFHGPENTLTLGRACRTLLLHRCFEYTNPLDVSVFLAPVSAYGLCEVHKGSVSRKLFVWQRHEIRPLLCCYLCYSATAHSAYAPLQLESARLYTTVGARVGLAPSRLPASNTTAGDQRVEGPTTTRPSLPIEGRRQLTSKRQE